MGSRQGFWGFRFTGPRASRIWNVFGDRIADVTRFLHLSFGLEHERPLLERSVECKAPTLNPKP